MYEHGLIPSDYTERPVYQTERTLELQYELTIGCDMADEMLRMPQNDATRLRVETIKGGGVRMLRTFSYVHPQYQEVVSLHMEYETRPVYKSEIYSIAVDVRPQTAGIVEGEVTTLYTVQKNAEMVTSAFIQSMDVEHGDYYPDRRMTVYDARQLFNELAEFSVMACLNREQE
jgi:hypothetical protein